MRSQLESKNSNGEWRRIGFRQIDDGEGIIYSDWHINLQPGEYYEFILRSDLIRALFEHNPQPVSGEYRFIYEIYNTEFQFVMNLYSKSFQVDVEL